MATETKDPQKKSNAISRFFGEFKEFISKGNVLDMAVGVVVGSAFTAIVNALVDNVLMPLVGAVIAGINFQDLPIIVKIIQIWFDGFKSIDLAANLNQ